VKPVISWGPVFVNPPVLRRAVVVVVRVDDQVGVGRRRERVALHRRVGRAGQLGLDPVGERHRVVARARLLGRVGERRRVLHRVARRRLPRHADPRHEGQIARLGHPWAREVHQTEVADLRVVAHVAAVDADRLVVAGRRERVGAVLDHPERHVGAGEDEAGGERPDRRVDVLREVLGPRGRGQREHHDQCCQQAPHACLNV
jgi:hypothetical protein